MRDRPIIVSVMIAMMVIFFPFLSGLQPVFGQTSAIRVGFDFRSGNQGWEAGFADYSPELTDLDLRAGLQGLPAEIGSPGTGFYIQGINRSDDLFMFLKLRLGPDDGILPNQTYRAVFGLTLASNAPSGCGGVGGAPTYHGLRQCDILSIVAAPSLLWRGL